MAFLSAIRSSFNETCAESPDNLRGSHGGSRVPVRTAPRAVSGGRERRDTRDTSFIRFSLFFWSGFTGIQYTRRADGRKRNRSPGHPIQHPIKKLGSFYEAHDTAYTIL